MAPAPASPGLSLLVCLAFQRHIFMFLPSYLVQDFLHMGCELLDIPAQVLGQDLAYLSAAVGFSQVQICWIGQAVPYRIVACAKCLVCHCLCPGCIRWQAIPGMELLGTLNQPGPYCPLHVQGLCKFCPLAGGQNWGILPFAKSTVEGNRPDAIPECRIIPAYFIMRVVAHDDRQGPQPGLQGIIVEAAPAYPVPTGYGLGQSGIDTHFGIDFRGSENDAGINLQGQGHHGTGILCELG